MKLLIGIDSGGTRTSVRLVADAGHPESLLQYEEVGALDGSLPPGQYSETFTKIIAKAAAKIAELPDSPIFLFLSAAGFSPPMRNEFSKILVEVLPQVIGANVSAAGAANDAVTLMLGHNSSVGVVAGTGSIVLIRKGAHLHQVGGHDWVACDQGSGFWIGLQSIRRVFRDLEEGNDSVLLQRLYEHLGLPQGNEDRLIQKAYELALAHPGMKREIARFAAAVCSAAERGDLVAQDIVKVEAEELADLAASGIRRHLPTGSSHETTGVLSGGLLSNDFYRRAFDNQVAMRLGSESSTPFPIRWEETKSGIDAAVWLAERMASGSTEFMDLDLDHRPVVAYF